VSLARVSQSSLKTDGGAARMVHVASSRRLFGDEAEDGWVDAMGCIILFYPNFVIFVVLGHKRSLQSNKKREDVVAVSAPCKLLIRINIAVCLC
jgi:hypothetical protein